MEGLVEYAKSEFVLNAVQDDKATLRHHLELIWKRTGKKPAQLDTPPLHPLVAHIWTWFSHLHKERTEMKTLTPGDILNWCWFNGVELLLWERQAIRILDLTWARSK